MFALNRLLKVLALASAASVLIEGPVSGGDDVLSGAASRSTRLAAEDTAFPQLPARLSELARQAGVRSRSRVVDDADLLDGLDDFRSESNAAGSGVRGLADPCCPTAPVRCLRCGRFAPPQTRWTSWIRSFLHRLRRTGWTRSL